MSTLEIARDYGSGPEQRKTFNCYGDFARFMGKGVPLKCLRQQAGSDARAQGILTLMEFGWAEGTAKLAKEVEFAVKHSPVGPAPVDYDVAGGIYDVESGIMGLPECFRVEEEYGRTPGPVKLVWGNSLSASFDDEDIERYGAAVVLLVQTLEARGIPVELSVEKRNQKHYGSNAYQSYNVLVKAMHEPVDLVRLAFPMMHPEATRAVSWAAHDAITGQVSQIPCRPLDPKDGETFILPTFAEFGASTDSAHAARKLAAWWESLELSGRDEWARMTQAEQDAAYAEATRRLFDAGRVGGSSVTDGHRLL